VARGRRKRCASTGEVRQAVRCEAGAVRAGVRQQRCSEAGAGSVGNLPHHLPTGLVGSLPPTSTSKRRKKGRGGRQGSR